MTLTQQLVELIRDKPIQQEDLNRASFFVLDALATAYAGTATPVGKKLIKWASQQQLNNRSRVFLIAALTHITETDDLHRASATHPGCIVVPCVLVLAQQLQMTSRAALEATLRGYESMCRIGSAVGPGHYKIWHNTATCGPFGSALAAAEILQLSTEQAVCALGNAGTQSSGLWQFLETGSMSKHLHAGRGSEAGLLSAELAQLDFTGPADILEGEKGFFAGLCPDPSPERVLAEPEAPWQLSTTSIKPWPSCRHTHPSVDAAIEIYAQLGNRVVEKVSVETYDAAIEICDRVSPTNEYQAKFSLQHCVSKALRQGNLGLHSFDEQARGESSALCQQVELRSTNPYRDAYPEAWGARVSVTTSDGAHITSSKSQCKGDPESMLSDAELQQKACGLMQFAGLSDKAITDICTQVLSLPDNGNCQHLADQFMQHAQNSIM